MRLDKELTRIMREESKYLIPAYYEIYKKIIPQMIKPFKKAKITKVVAIESAGLFYGSIIAYKLKVPFVQILKGNRIKDRSKVVLKEFIDYSKEKKSLDILKNSIKAGDNILLVDDWFETGASGKAIIEEAEKVGAKIVGTSVVFNKLKKQDEDYFNKYNFHYLARLEPTL